MLRDITIENYRLFEKFQIEGLTQVNLLVGANNSGKSSLLEAIYLLVNHEDRTALSNIIDNRFVLKSRLRRDREDESSNIFPVSTLFRGYKPRKDYHITLSSQKDQQMSLKFNFIESKPKRNDRGVGVSLQFTSGERKFDNSFDLDELFVPWYREKYQVEKPKVNKHLVTADRLDQQSITNLWEQIILTSKEDTVLEILRTLEPNLERIALINQTTPGMSVLIKIKDNEVPIPLGSMGDGMYRIFALALSLVNCENGALFVDEIDTGLHYKALIKMWRLVIETAKRLNVQVFVTTHSWDCLTAFHQALTETSATDLGSVFRLERKDDQIKYVSYSGDKLAVAIDHDIEVR
ncbi:MAG: AAA family ATPase [Anaerolineales bacterium]|nr:AAA family ATPase [Anaerolineales bacterium]